MCDVRPDLVIIVQRFLRVIWIQLIVILRAISALHAVFSVNPAFQQLPEVGVIRNLHYLVHRVVAEVIAQRSVAFDR